jgi:hypothetical protein
LSTLPITQAAQEKAMNDRQLFLGLWVLILSVPMLYALDHKLAFTMGAGILLLLYYAAKSTRRRR